MSASDPFAPPISAPPAASMEEGQAEIQRFRRDLLGQEGWVWGVGLLWIAGGALNLAFMAAWIVQAARLAGGVRALPVVAMVAGAALQIIGGIQLARLRASGRTLVTAALALALVSVVRTAANGREVGEALVTGLIPAVIIASLWSHNAGIVLSPRYRQEIIPATPGIRRALPPMIAVMLAIVLVVMGWTVFGILSGRG